MQEQSTMERENCFLTFAVASMTATGSRRKLLITCNPKKQWLKREYADPWKDRTSQSSRKFVQAFATDNKHGSAEHIKSLSEGQDTAILHTITMEIIAAAAVTALAQWLKK